MAFATAESIADGGAGKLNVLIAELSTTNGDGAAKPNASAGEITAFVDKGSTSDDDGAVELKASAGETKALIATASLAGDDDVGTTAEFTESMAGEVNAASATEGSTLDNVGAAEFHVWLAEMGGSVLTGTDESNVSLADSRAPSDSVVAVGTACSSGDADHKAAAASVEGKVGLSHDVSCVT